MFIATIALAWLAQDAPAAAPQPAPAAVRVETGTRIPLSLLNSVSTKNAAEGDRVYLETVFPIIVASRVVIPVGSSVAGTVTTVKRAGRVKGRSELFVRFDTLILPNGIIRDFRSRMSNVDGTNPGRLDREEGKIQGDGNKSGDAKGIGEAATTGTIVGAIAGSAAGRAGMGAGIGAAAGVAAAMIGVLATRGPDAVLGKGTTVEMILDRPITFDDAEIDFSRALPVTRRSTPGDTTAPARQSERPGWKRAAGIP